MTNEEAIETIKRIRFSKIEMRDCPEREALTLAIKALENEPKKGEWIHYIGCGVGKAVCSECGQLGETKKYCGNCGRRMGGGYS